MSTTRPGGVTFDIVEEQWIGSRVTTDDQGEISRQLEWFDAKSDAERFARTGVK